MSGKKRLSTKQIFQTSDKISYGFNKIDPFSITAKKTVSELINEAQKNKKKKEAITSSTKTSRATEGEGKLFTKLIAQ